MIRRSTLQGLVVTAALLAVAGARPAQAQETAPAEAEAGTGGSGTHSAFGPGEQLTYRVQYLGMHAGTAQVTVGAETFQWGREVLPIV